MTTTSTDKIEKDRGLYLVIFDMQEGAILQNICFDTYKSSEIFEWFIHGVVIPKGSVVIIACKDDCVTNLSDKCK